MKARTLLNGFWDPQASSNPADDSEIYAYWAAYGGAKAIWSSNYLWIALVCTALFRPLWCPGEWTDIGLDILPSLLGFSIGALAIMLAMPGFGVFDVIAEGGDSRSAFMTMASRLVHFIIVQVLALFVLMVAKAYPSNWANGIGFCLLAYALLSAIAAALSLFAIARILNFSARRPPHNPDVN